MYLRNIAISADNKYRECSILGKSVPVDLVKGGRPRKRKENASRPVQKNLNYRNAQKWFRLSAVANFNEGDYTAEFTFAPEFKPKSVEECEKEIKNFIKRINRARNKKNLPKMKYLGVIEGKTSDNLHFHMILDNLLNRDEIDDLWTKGRGKNKKSIGFTHINKIKSQNGQDGVIIKANYLTKEFKLENQKGKRKWFSSRNLKKPVVERSQNWKYTDSKIARLLENDELEQQLEKDNAGWELIEFPRKNPDTQKDELVKLDIRENEYLGTLIYYRMRRKTQRGINLSRKNQILTRKTLAGLEEQMRLYPEISRLKAEALLTSELSDKHDITWWVEKDNATKMINKKISRENKAYKFYDQLEKDIDSTVSGLAPELQRIIEECFWGENKYYDWSTIGLVYLGVGTRQIYAIRYQILELFALHRGVMF